MKERKPEVAHVLQKTGLLSAFGVAVAVHPKDLNDLKRLIRSVAESEEEYHQMFKEEIEKLYQLDGPTPPPGVIIPIDDTKKQDVILNMAKFYKTKLKKLNWSKDQLCLFFLTLITTLGLEQSDFDVIIEKYGDSARDSDEDSDDDEDED